MLRITVLLVVPDPFVDLDGSSVHIPFACRAEVRKLAFSCERVLGCTPLPKFKKVIGIVQFGCFVSWVDSLGKPSDIYALPFQDCHIHLRQKWGHDTPGSVPTRFLLSSAGRVFVRSGYHKPSLGV
jgi:hypothetical protein